MSYEAEMPGSKVSQEQLQMICCRYHTAAQFIHGKQVLEVGCGAGLGLGYLARRAKRVIGGDYAEENVRCAQQYYNGRVELLSLDANSLPFKDNSLDVVLLFEVIYYLSQPGKFLDECRRILVDEGSLILCLPNKDLPGFHKSPLSIRYYSIQELFALLSQHHFGAEMFGAFPITRGATWQKLWAGMVIRGGKVLDLMPKGRKIKEFLKGLIFSKTLVLKEEVEDGDMAAEELELVPLRYDCPDFRHRILYAIAHARRM